MKLKPLDPGFVIILLMLLALGIFVLILALQLRQDSVTEAVKNDPLVPVLFVITDDEQIRVSQLLLVETGTRRLAQFELPYNLGMIHADLGRVDRISVLYEERGIQTYQDRVSNFFNQGIPFRIEMDIDAFARLADLLGGVPVSVNQAIDLQDDNGIIRIPSGNVALGGDKLVEYLRLIQVGEGAQDRSNRSFAAVRGFLSRIESAESILNSPAAKQLLDREIASNLSGEALFSLIQLFKGLNYENVLTQRVLGVERVVQTPEGEIPLLFPHFEGQLARDSVRQMRSSLALESDEEVPLGQIKVEVLNGTRTAGLARRTSDLFVNYGLDVRSYANAEDQDLEFTQIIYYTNIQAARRVAGLIRAEQIIVGTHEGPEFPDVTVILGRDFDGWYVR